MVRGGFVWDATDKLNGQRKRIRAVFEALCVCLQKEKEFEKRN